MEALSVVTYRFAVDSMGACDSVTASARSRIRRGRQSSPQTSPTTVIPIIGDVFGLVEAANKPDPCTTEEVTAVKSFRALISEDGNCAFEMDRPAWAGIGLVQAVLYLFFRAGFMVEVGIDPVTLFSLIGVVRETYSDRLAPVRA